MAPEQYSSDTITIPQAIDVFAMGVIIHEVMTDGFHPSGVRTADVWPAVGGKYSRQNIWQNWARSGQQVDIIPETKLRETVQRAIAPIPEDRPSILEVEASLWSALEHYTPESSSLSTLIDAYEGMYFENGLNGYMTTWLKRREKDTLPR